MTTQENEFTTMNPMEQVLITDPSGLVEVQEWEENKWTGPTEFLNKLNFVITAYDDFFEAQDFPQGIWHFASSHPRGSFNKWVFVSGRKMRIIEEPFYKKTKKGLEITDTPWQPTRNLEKFKNKYKNERCTLVDENGFSLFQNKIFTFFRIKNFWLKISKSKIMEIPQGEED